MTAGWATDLNEDDLVGFGDYTELAACRGGPEAALAPGCATSDLDADADADMADLAVSQADCGRT